MQIYTILDGNLGDGIDADEYAARVQAALGPTWNVVVQRRSSGYNRNDEDAHDIAQRVYEEMCHE